MSLPPKAAAQMTPADFLARRKAPGLRPLPRGGEEASLSFAQERLWFLTQLDGAGDAYHLPLIVKLSGRLDREALARALSVIVDRHEPLRARFAAETGQPVLRIAPPGHPVPLPMTELTDAGALTAALRSEIDAPFDLAAGPMLRARLFKTGPEDHHLVLTLHHIATDGWSTAILVRELGAAYGALLAGGTPDLPTLPIAYADFAAWQRNQRQEPRFERQMAFWESLLKGAPDRLDLATDRPRPPMQSFAGAWEPFNLDTALTADLKALSRRIGGTIFSVLLTAWGLVLHRFSGQERPVVGMPVANRTRSEVEELIGFFANTLALRLPISETATLSEVLQQTRDLLLDAQDHQEVPFEQVIERLNPPRSLAYPPLFQTMISWQSAERPAVSLAGLTAEILPPAMSVAKYDLTLELAETPTGAITGGIEYATALFDPTTIRRFHAAFVQSLRALVDQPEALVGAVPLLSAPETAQAWADGQGPIAPLPEGIWGVHQLFERHAAQTPEALALVWREERWSYARLNRAANRLAYRLMAAGVGAEARVGLCLPPGPTRIAAVLAVLKAGGAFVPLDPAYPPARLRFLLTDSAPTCLIGTPESLALLGETDIPIVGPEEGSEPERNPDGAARGLNRQSLAYLLYTSGSTGTPKGVMVEHGQLLALSTAWTQRDGFVPKSWLQMAGFAFDVFTADWVRALTSGGSLILCDRDPLLDPPALYALMRRENVAYADFVPALLDTLMLHLERHGGNLGFLETVFCGSDRWSLASARRLRALTGPAVRIVHAYGVTEATIDSCGFTLPADLSALAALPIGVPLPNTSALILDRAGQPVPMGVAGELYLGGAGVARGYWRRDDLTAERFVTLPQGRFYRSGDLARATPAGMEFLGRADSQVKIRGQRVELGEIEAVLNGCPGVAESLVFAQGGPDAPQLIAYLRTTDPALDPATLAPALAAHLPEAMIPAGFVIVDRFPLTPNGKIDRAALPAPTVLPRQGTPFVLPEGPIETDLAALWAKLLNRAPIGRQDHFFESGGHSLLAVRLAAEIGQQFSISLSPAIIFEAPRLADLAERIAAASRPALPPIEPARRDRPISLSAAQARLWFLARLDGGEATYNMPLALAIEGPLNRPALARALDRIADRHEALRTRFIEIDGVPHQDILPPGLGFPLTCDPAEGLTETECRARLAADAARAFDLTNAPLARGLLLTRGAESHWLLLTLHHAISDGWSMGVFARELADLYRAFTEEQPDPLPPLALQPADVTVWQQTHLTVEALADDAAYWRARLAEVPPLLTLPTDAPRPAKQDFKGGLIRFEVPAETLTALKTLTHRTETSLFMALLTAWAAVLGRLSGQETLVIGAPTANRPQAELEGVIGFFVNTLALRFDLAEATSLLDLLRQTRATVLAAQEHQALPFGTIVEQVNPPRSLSHTPIFQTMLTWEDEGSASLPLPGLTVTPLALPHHSAKFDLLLTLREEGGRLVGGLEFAAALFAAATAQRFERYFQRALRQLAESPETALASLDLLGVRDRSQILTAWNPPPTPRAFISVPDRLTARAAETPAAPALRFQGEDMSYGRLETEANRLAHRLIAANLRPGAPVGLCLPRGFSMVVAVLAVLKAGGACLPLDPDYPAARLAVMVGEAQPPLILTETVLAERLPPTVPRLCLDALPPAALPESAPAVALTSEGLAYLLYTSGSTGTPKGVAQSHRLLSHLVDWQAAQTTPAPRRVLQFASLNFDVAFQEIVTTLCTGATLVLIPNETRRDLAALGPFIVAEGIERAFLPFAVLSQMAALGLERPAASGSACEVITAGEAVQVSDALRAFLRGLGGRYFYNQYGPTETHVATQHRLDLAEADAWPVHPPIGRPVDFAQTYLLTETLTPVPVGGVGEIYIGGAGVALGYYGQPALTAERFIANPFGPGHLYRSGDLGRYRADGGIEFLGRGDQQVKWRGFRIETGDIEAALRALPSVADAATVLRDAGDGTRQLVAYLVGPADPARLRPALAARLPDYMLPSHWVALPQLPLTPNGKLDRRALPAPQAPTAETYRAPATPEEQALAPIWATILKLPRVGRDDNFFDLGGHSLLATRLIHAINQTLKTHLSLSALFENPTVAQLATKLAAASAVADEAAILTVITPAPADRFIPFPLTDIQEAYWVGRADGLALGGVSAHAYDEIRLSNFDPARFETALQRLIDRHDGLKTIFRSDGTQQVLADLPPYRLPVDDFRALDADAAETALRETRARMSHQMLDAARWPLFEFRVSLLPSGHAHLHISLDALIVDAASTQILAHELVHFYTQPDAPLPPLGLTFRDYVLAEQGLRAGPAYRRALRYWQERLAHLPPAPDLPLARAPETITVPTFTRRDRQIPAATWSALKDQAKRQGVTASVLLLTAYAQVLALWSRAPRFTLTLPLFNRLPLHPDVGGIMGDFTSIVLLEVDYRSDQSFRSNARALQAQLWRDMDHAAVSGVRVVRELARVRGEQQTALPIVFNSTLIEMGPGGADISLTEALGAEPVHTITQTPQVWIDHTILEINGVLEFNWDSIDALFPDGLTEAMFAAYCRLLDQLSAPEAWEKAAVGLLPSLATLPPLPPPTEPERDLLHRLFERSANRTPDAPAILLETGAITYAGLRDRATHLGALLQQSGAQPGTLVAILMQPGWEQTLAALGILYSGAAYLPLDPDLPEERLRYILAQTDCRIVLYQSWSAARDKITDPTLTRIAVDRLTPDGSAVLTPFPHPETDLAYVIFTSGSTGVPKGVMIDHAGAVTTLLDINARFGITASDRVLAVSALSFDLSVFDIFGTLAAGGAIVPLSPASARDPARWVEIIQQQGVTVWNSAPALASLLTEYAEGVGTAALRGLRVVMMSGDWIPVTLPDRLRALAPGAALYSLGGATEASIWSILYPIGSVDPAWRSIPYGRALTHQRFYVLDEGLNQRPDWVPGELFIAGAGLARGYWRDDAQSAARFFPHPHTGERLYRTGDLGRRRPDGVIEFLGRIDTQVKVQGYRIELGEIESTLERHPEVKAAVARIWGDAQAEKRLAAYVVLHRPVEADALLAHLRQSLPAYMVPSSLGILDALPISPNGKIDRNRLPSPQAAVAEAESRPLTPAESGILGLIAGVLKLPSVAPADNLLTLGATSIDIVRIVNALATQTGFRPPLAALMAKPTVQELLRLFREANPPPPPAPTAAEALAPLDDPADRAAFKDKALGLRRFAGMAETLDLPPPAFDRYAAYRSVRAFKPTPIPYEDLARLLGCLARNPVVDAPKHHYASAGGLYPVQTYLYAKPERVAGLPGGAYYYDPARHRLIPTSRGKSLPADAYDFFVNRPVFEDSGFALFFIAERAAIEPLYGEKTLDFCHIEAGSMTQLLTMVAADLGLGLCGMGSVAPDALGALFDLGPTHQPIYAMVGGLRTDAPPPAPLVAPAADADLEEIEL